jgi:hypothetical protein
MCKIEFTYASLQCYDTVAASNFQFRQAYCIVRHKRHRNMARINQHDGLWARQIVARDAF